ncbi:MAG: AAA family ATPase [Spirosomataceae bacterium]
MTDTMTSIFDFATIQPTDCQSKALFEMEEFLGNPSGCQVFVLRGSAGTGKTTLMKTVVEYLKATDKPFGLLAPTAKAAKVLSSRTNEIASTVHHLIYNAETAPDGTVYLSHKENDADLRTVYIVDEASMLGVQRATSENFISPDAILNDLMRFLKQGHPESQLIFIGDTYQLAPVNEQRSVALSARDVFEIFGLSAQQATLKTVVRQAAESPVLRLANEIKQAKDANLSLYTVKPTKLKNSSAALTFYLHHFNRHDLGSIILIGKSNEQVDEWNNTIREALSLNDRTLTEGDVIMLNKSHYDGSEILIKGEMGVIKCVDTAVEERAGLRFTDVEVAFESRTIKAKVMLNSLITEKGFVEGELLRNLKADRMKHNRTYRESEKTHDDPYMNALQLRYGYAITCHKAQGSEWKRVLFTPRLHRTDHRWLYTTVTRASEQVLSWWF